MVKYIYIIYLWMIFIIFAAKAVYANNIVIEKSSEKIEKLLKTPLEEYKESLDEDDNIAYKIEKRAKDILVSEGYYDANILTETKDDDIIVTPFAGDIYKIASINYDGDADILDVTKRKVPLKVGDILRADDVIYWQKKMVRRITSKFCRYDRGATHDITLDRYNKTADIHYKLITSPKATFGDTGFISLNNVKGKVLRPYVSYDNGVCFSRKELKKTTANLIQTGLFHSVHAHLEPQDNTEPHIVDIYFEFTERKHRTKSYGIGTSIEEPIILSAGHEWRNINQSGTLLSLNTRVSPIRQSFNTALKFPNVDGEDQSITFGFELANENFDSFDAQTGTVSALYETLLWDEQYISSFGTRGRYSVITNSNAVNDNYLFLGPTASLAHDKRDDILRPTTGYHWLVQTFPAFDVLNTNRLFIKNEIRSSYYQSLGKINAYDETKDSVIAGRLSLGQIFGSDFNDVPINERFFSGGSNTVRGYGFEELGDFVAGDPIGGLSSYSASVEARIAWDDVWGNILFLDAGNVNIANTPDFKEEPRFAAGFGVRYYSDFFPLRFDIGFPLNPRARDDAFAFYLGIGEAF